MQNISLSKVQKYFVNVWFSPEIGIVKLEGCKALINPVTGGSFNLADSNKVIRHILTSSN